MLTVACFSAASALRTTLLSDDAHTVDGHCDSVIQIVKQQRRDLKDKDGNFPRAVLNQLYDNILDLQVNKGVDIGVNDQFLAWAKTFDRGLQCLRAED